MSGADEFTAASQSFWSAAAPGWAALERQGGPYASATNWLLEAAALRPGDHVLEVACGSGDVGLRAAEVVGPEGRVVCTDFAEPMVEAVRERARELGLENVEAEVADAQREREDGRRFDAVLCRFGYMLMPDPVAALAAGRAALNDDGRLVLAVWGPAERNPWLSALTDAVMAAVGAPPPPPGTPGPFALGDRDRLREVLTAAGFGYAAIEDCDSEREFGSLEEWWGGTQQASGAISSLLAQLPADQVEAIRQAALAAAERYVGEDGAVRFPARVLAARVTAAA
jgi:SAM-dependent methyltransferase